MSVMNSAVVTAINGHAVGSLAVERDAFYIGVEDMIELRNSVNIIEEIVKSRFEVHHGKYEMPKTIADTFAKHVERISATLKRVEDGVMLDEL